MTSPDVLRENSALATLPWFSGAGFHHGMCCPHPLSLRAGLHGLLLLVQMEPMHSLSSAGSVVIPADFPHSQYLFLYLGVCDLMVEMLGSHTGILEFNSCF